MGYEGRDSNDSGIGTNGGPNGSQIGANFVAPDVTRLQTIALTVDDILRSLPPIVK